MRVSKTRLITELEQEKQRLESEVRKMQQLKDTSTTKSAIDIPKDARVDDCSDLLEICRDTARACGFRECFLLGLGRTLGGPGLESLSKHDAVALSLARTFLAEPDIILIDHF